MTELIASGRLIDLILVLMLVEAMLLYVHRRRTGRGLPAGDIAVNLVAGASLMLAVRAALTDAAPGWIAACLAVSLFAHLADLAIRWRAHPVNTGSGRPDPADRLRQAGTRA
jgi:hypothetical protein